MCIANRQEAFLSGAIREPRSPPWIIGCSPLSGSAFGYAVVLGAPFHEVAIFPGVAFFRHTLCRFVKSHGIDAAIRWQILPINLWHEALFYTARRPNLDRAPLREKIPYPPPPWSGTKVPDQAEERSSGHQGHLLAFFPQIINIQSYKSN
jgi:hypothetical protein